MTSVIPQGGYQMAPPRKYSEASSRMNERRFTSRFIPSRSPPTPPSCSPSFHSRSGRNHHSDDSRDDPNRSFEFGGRFHHRISSLPIGSFDPLSGHITHSLEQILNEGVLDKFAKDKAGCKFLKDELPEEGSPLRARLFVELEKHDGTYFKELCQDVFANFFVQRLIERASGEEQKWIARMIGHSMFHLCMNRYSCRVIQKAIEHLPSDLSLPLLRELDAGDLVQLAVDQNANHVVQRIFSAFDLCHWSFIVATLMKEPTFFTVVENKYGCRVIQLAIEQLSSDMASSPDQIAYENETQAARRRRIGSVVDTGDEVEWVTVSCGDIVSPTRLQLLQQLMSRVVVHCERLSSNEYANYIVQHVIENERLAVYRELIIERCLLCKLLSLSQEKYASHVVEKALEHAGSKMLREMMDEIFDGYVPHPATKKDALDILLFHQFGNYVVQRMLTICLGKDKCAKPRLDDEIREHWLARLEARINHNDRKLLRYSSGKRILDMLRACRGGRVKPAVIGGVTGRVFPPSSPHPSSHNNNQYHRVMSSPSMMNQKHGYGSPAHGYSNPSAALGAPRIPDQYR